MQFSERSGPDAAAGRFYTFVELEEFSQDWAQLGLDVEHDLADLQLLIMADPLAAPLMAGTGKLRKIRFAPRLWNIGKRGAVRVCYVLYPDQSIVLLVLAFGKHQQANLTAEEKRGVKLYLDQFGQWLDERAAKRRKK